MNHQLSLLETRKKLKEDQMGRLLMLSSHNTNPEHVHDVAMTSISTIELPRFLNSVDPHDYVRLSLSLLR